MGPLQLRGLCHVAQSTWPPRIATNNLKSENCLFLDLLYISDSIFLIIFLNVHIDVSISQKKKQKKKNIDVSRFKQCTGVTKKPTT